MFEDHYLALGVPRDASDDEVKKAYYALARKCHPDLHSEDKAAKKKFQRIQRSFEVLGDREKREKYNKQYDAKFRSNPNPTSPTPPNPTPPTSPPFSTQVGAVPPPGPTFYKPKRLRNRSTIFVQIFGGAFVGLALAYFALALLAPDVLREKRATIRELSKGQNAPNASNGKTRNGSPRVPDSPRDSLKSPPKLSPESNPPKRELRKRQKNPPDDFPDRSISPLHLPDESQVEKDLVEKPSKPPTIDFDVPKFPEPEPANKNKKDNDQEQVDKLTAAFQNSADPKDRLNAIKTIRSADGAVRRLLLPMIVSATEDVSPDVCVESLYILGELGSDATPALVTVCKMLDGNNENVARAAVVAMLRIDASSEHVKSKLAPLLRAGRNRTDQKLIRYRIWICDQIAQYGALAKWAEPLLCDNLEATAKNLDFPLAVDLFVASSKAIGNLESINSTTIRLLDTFGKGKGMRPDGSSNIDKAKAAADTAFRTQKDRQETATLESPHGDAVIKGMPAKFGKEGIPRRFDKKMFYAVAQVPNDTRVAITIHNTPIGDYDISVDLKENGSGVHMTRAGLDFANMTLDDLKKPEVIVHFSGKNITSVSWNGLQVRPRDGKE